MENDIYIIGEKGNDIISNILKSMIRRRLLLDIKFEPRDYQKSLLEKISDIQFLRESCGVTDKGEQIKFKRPERFDVIANE